MQRLIDAGYPRDQMDHHYSDLYVYVTPLTCRVIEEWLADNGWSRQVNNSFLISTFVDQITGRKMFDIAFQYYEEESE